MHFLDESAWAVAQSTAKQVFKVDYFIDDLGVMEQDIQKIGREFLKCNDIKDQQILSQCFNVIADTMKDAARDFSWDQNPSISKWNRIKYGIMFLTLAVFDAHISIVAKNAPLEKKYELGKRYSFIFERFNSLLFEFEDALETWRFNQVNPVKICEIHSIMWKEFQGTCETRWRRSADEDENEINSGLGSSYDVESLIDEKVERIGNNFLHKRKYRASVNDIVTEHVVFQEDILLDTGNRGVGIHDVFQRARDARWKYIESIKNDMPRFNEDVVRVARHIIESTIKYLQK